MNEETISGEGADPLERSVRSRLAQSDAIITTARPILRHLLANDDHALFSDLVVARVRGMMSDIARQLLHAVAVEAEVDDRGAFVEKREAKLAGLLLRDTELLAHAHACTIEAQLAERLGQRSGIDPVLSPLVQELTASENELTAAEAIHLLSAQARFMQQCRRMQMSLDELPGDLFHKALVVLGQTESVAKDIVLSAEHKLRQKYDESARRVALISRLVMGMQRKATRALEIDHAGLAIFISALAISSGQGRDLTILSLGENQALRLALLLRAAGLSDKAMQEQVLFLHPEADFPQGFERLTAATAEKLLAESQPNTAE